ncbi:hypothetical protein B0J12DRAFT_649862 [Macrophomina phaseolina]|uniref:Uncharacterized protein n=1 Tax=Macrophomina phaseolina TaxID=35725 RepID=A0ABQ8GQ34_9PEZI|nr:hypothetical protein B0J12DRAFT_649862 [Macrophomina phaseolina]
MYFHLASIPVIFKLIIRDADNVIQVPQRRLLREFLNERDDKGGETINLPVPKLCIAPFGSCRRTGRGPRKMNVIGTCRICLKFSKIVIKVGCDGYAMLIHAVKSLRNGSRGVLIRLTGNNLIANCHRLVRLGTAQADSRVVRVLILQCYEQCLLLCDNCHHLVVLIRHLHPLLGLDGAGPLKRLLDGFLTCGVLCSFPFFQLG